MAGFWPSDEARARLPAIADGMSRAEKIVVSDTLKEPVWGPVEVIRGDIAARFRALKAQAGPDLLLLGSG